MTATYDMTWVALEVVHGMQDGDAEKQLVFVLSLAADPFPNADARNACRDFAEACQKHGVELNPHVAAFCS